MQNSQNMIAAAQIMSNNRMIVDWYGIAMFTYQEALQTLTANEDQIREKDRQIMELHHKMQNMVEINGN